ncbi:MAG: DUF389 domain-containing protein [Chloroflexi bacterium]|nr:DUF389 domain-containing protein [Ardenticatenaceae bacterium]MBL1131266.1 DUF389 domain-containing protein [Chloroflexota bacterium]NOG37366.1 DUF389 domain-containing protein [Chloroflexota bacterium]GIK57652.1 MAG: membrane protein [Chloroflexota bacterium]
MSTLSNIIRENRFRPEDVPRFADKLFYEEQRRRPYLERFFALLFLSTIIATAGILGDSTATVIGAMIVAPLMTPIMATAAALIMGNMRRAIQSLLLVTMGMMLVIFLSWLWGTVHPGVISFEGNSQIVGRISPRLIDLIAALASGAAGAFCLSRDDIADSLPGVAIAISLAPPLCVVGISISADEWDAAMGALLLFVTNFLSILLAGGGVLALLGLNKAAMIEVHGTTRRNAFVAIAIAILAVTVPLTVTGQKVAREARTEVLSRRAAAVWVADTDYDVRQIRVIEDNVYIAMLGNGAQRPFAELVTAVQQSVDRPVIVTLETVPSEKISSSAEE